MNLGYKWQCANRTVMTDKAECSDFLNSCHTLLDLTGPLQLGSLPATHQADIPPLDGCIRSTIDFTLISINPATKCTFFLKKNRVSHGNAV